MSRRISAGIVLLVLLLLVVVKEENFKSKGTSATSQIITPDKASAVNLVSKIASHDDAPLARKHVTDCEQGAGCRHLNLYEMHGPIITIVHYCDAAGVQHIEMSGNALGKGEFGGGYDKAAAVTAFDDGKFETSQRVDRPSPFVMFVTATEFNGGSTWTVEFGGCAKKN